jgi:hypothetical protein
MTYKTIKKYGSIIDTYSRRKVKDTRDGRVIDVHTLRDGSNSTYLTLTESSGLGTYTGVSVHDPAGATARIGTMTDGRPITTVLVGTLDIALYGMHPETLIAALREAIAEEAARS